MGLRWFFFIKPRSHIFFHIFFCSGCQFFITCSKAEWLDGKHCVFGRVLDAQSMLTVRKCEAVPVHGDKPRLPLRITQCGELWGLPPRW
jgi:hypothetical protein